MSLINSVCVVFCIATCLVLGIALIFMSVMEKDWFFTLLSIMLLVISISSLVTINSVVDETTYIPAEPLAHNQTQTVFTTDEGTYIADGLYSDGTYLLTVDGKDVLVVWQAVDGEVG